MGYELEKLKNQYGVGSESLSYGGAETPVPATDDKSTTPQAGGDGGGSQTPSSYEEARKQIDNQYSKYYFTSYMKGRGFNESEIADALKNEQAGYEANGNEGTWSWGAKSYGRGYNPYTGSNSANASAFNKANADYRAALQKWEADNPQDKWKAPTPSTTPGTLNAAELAKYKEDQRLYDDYTRAYKERLLNTDMYGPVQNRQILNSPVYSGADPRLAPNPQWTISNQERDQNSTLPNLVSKYALNPAPINITTPEQPQPQAGGGGNSNLTPEQRLQLHRSAYAARGGYDRRAEGGVIELHNKYSHGGHVKTHYAYGDLVDLSGTDDEDTTDTGTDTVSVAPSAYDALLAKYQDVDPEKLAAARADYRAKQQAIIDQMAEYAKTQQAEQPDKSEMYFRLAQAFLTPGKTGNFSEGLANAGGVMADYQKELRAQQRADAAAQLQLGLKQNELLANMSQEDLQLLEKEQAKTDAARQAIELAQIKAGGTTSGMVPELAKYQLYRQKLLDSGVPADDIRIKQLDDKIHILTTRAPTASATNLYDADTVTMLAQRVIAGDKTALTGLGRSQASMAAVQKRVTELLKQSGVSPEDIIKAQQTLSQQQKVLTGFASTAANTQGGQIAAMNMLTGHIGILEQAASALNRGDVAAFNRVKTMWEQETNQPLPNNLGLISQLVGDELQKAAVGGAGGVEERKDLKNKLYSGGANYNTIKEAAEYASHLAAQRVGVLKQQWNAVKLPEEDFNAYLTPATQAVLSRPAAPPARPAGVPATAGYSPSQHKWFWKDAQGKTQSAAAQ